MRLTAVKFVNHADDYPEDPVLRVRPLGAAEVKDVYRRLAARLGLEAGASSKLILRGLEDRLVLVREANAEADDFNPLTVLDSSVVDVSTEAFFTFGEPEELWRIALADLARYFDSIWYSGPDDLTLWSSGLAWAIGISHEGAVKAALL